MSHLAKQIEVAKSILQQNVQGKSRIELPIGSLPFSSIDWLAEQSSYPQFYWQSRDQREEVVALGQLATFTQLDPAYTILADNQRIWGGRGFAYKDSTRCMDAFFFLPAIELIRRDKSWSIAFNISSEPSRTLNAIDKLVIEPSTKQILNTTISSMQHIPTQKQWSQDVNKALSCIETTSLKKVVLARKTTVELDQSIRACQLLKASHIENQHSFHFLLSLDSKHSFMGSTPERLYSRIEADIETEALAGTIGRGFNATEDMELANWLSQDKKNLQENQYVVDDIVERLKPYCCEIETQKEARLVRLRNVQHLKRHIHARLSPDAAKSQLLEALQPTAAVAGLPRDSAIEFITETEQFRRGWYSGSVGYISHARAEFCVAIRSALVQGKQVQLFTGAGIVPGSNPETEWIELNKKMATLLSLLQSSDSLEVAS